MVCVQMLLQLVVVPERLATLAALEVVDPRVHGAMLLQSCVAAELLLAELALVVVDALVSLHVTLVSCRARERSATVGALADVVGGATWT